MFLNIIDVGFTFVISSNAGCVYCCISLVLFRLGKIARVSLNGVGSRQRCLSIKCVFVIARELDRNDTSSGRMPRGVVARPVVLAAVE